MFTQLKSDQVLVEMLETKGVFRSDSTSTIQVLSSSVVIYQVVRNIRRNESSRLVSYLTVFTLDKNLSNRQRSKNRIHLLVTMSDFSLEISILE